MHTTQTPDSKCYVSPHPLLRRTKPSSIPSPNPRQKPSHPIPHSQPTPPQINSNQHHTQTLYVPPTARPPFPPLNPISGHSYRTTHSPIDRLNEDTWRLSGRRVGALLGWRGDGWGSGCRRFLWCGRWRRCGSFGVCIYSSPGKGLRRGGVLLYSPSLPALASF
jgi:hypothetical protein